MDPAPLPGPLAPYAVTPETSGGRRYREDEHPYRNPFQRDRDRVLHCSAFRRLDYKTQVFAPHQNDHFRTRLTHTLEVSLVGRNLARALGANEDLTEAVALAHDLGHPPFGHAGEAVLDELMADHGRFEHNRQSLRIVDYLEHPYPSFRGLNLTRATRECIAGHETKYDIPLDDDLVADGRAPLEGQLVDLADEIAYTSADLDDALQARWIDPTDLAELSLWRMAIDCADAEWPTARPIHKQIRACKIVLALLADDALNTTGENLADLGPAGVDDIRHAPRRVAAFSPEMTAHKDQLQEFLLHNVYRYGANLDHDRRAREVLRELFGAFAARPDLLPDRYLRRVGDDGLPRVICDYIAGMTDRFCRQEHTRVTNG